jgi:hypothetical protein
VSGCGFGTRSSWASSGERGWAMGCPPDFAILVIDYVPDRWLVESKSLKLYLHSFRDHGFGTRSSWASSGERGWAMGCPSCRAWSVMSCVMPAPRSAR